MSTTNPPAASADPTSSSRPARRGSIMASRPLAGWRTVDLLTIAFLGAAFGVAYWGWGIAYTVPSNALGAVFAPLAALIYGPWLIAGIVGGLVVRRPGAALLCEVVAALVSMIPGTAWGVDTLYSGLLEGLGVEVVLALFLYRRFGWTVAALAGAASGAVEAVYEVFKYYGDWALGWQAMYVVCFAVSGVVIAGLGGWALTRALAGAGGLGAFPAGQEVRESRAV
ncbi:energy-coupling factor transport system substrate-specific component [Phycicoccus badiiscoriae]|uniref:Energy-coupling factor transport system substrate-specific component n=1 Tax=Pedococcus badiiscoriae TaxID=642776 RepID=A0A852WCK9_9MICO|nr:ECF transporter S component [Pedococcus badiiscoriae]NYG07017.1 energy-coupling factor transport system substrate-specific component [Pedococcus badiiscoriae]